LLRCYFPANPPAFPCSLQVRITELFRQSAALPNRAKVWRRYAPPAHASYLPNNNSAGYPFLYQ